MMSTRAIDRYAIAHDASHYLLIPSEVVKVKDSDDLISQLKQARQPITFRSGGTSLSGQGVTDGLLLDTRANFKKIEVLDNGARVRVEPGATVHEVNTRLARYGFKLGPDPASEFACTIGGVIANNSSGMVCGREFNAYKTLESLQLIFANGIRINTADFDADAKFKSLMPELYKGLSNLKDRVRTNPKTVNKIMQQFQIKNTMGYSVNAFLDFTTPIEILTHLIVGSEGTLAFIAEATFRTVPIKPHASTALLICESINEATEHLAELAETGLAAIELLDTTSLLVAQKDAKAWPELKSVKVANQAALIMEFQELTRNELDQKVGNSETLFRKLAKGKELIFHEDKKIRGDLWHTRKGLYASVSGNRPTGSTALLEDIAVPLPALAETCSSLMELFTKHDYQDCVIFGHAKDGNIHFLLKERFDIKTSIIRYAQFTEEMVELVLSHNGTLKAEHGTGRIMAPFVRRQFGEEIYAVMQEIKNLFDPQNIFNPGIVISDDPELHLKHLKPVPTIEKEVDRCVECGYCEPICPSKNLTLTPRQRIVLRRELEIARTNKNLKLVREIEKDYRYASVDTCAVDGMCQIACPVGINTGDLVRNLRTSQSSNMEKNIWNTLSRHWAIATKVLSLLVVTAHRIPKLSQKAINVAHRISEKVPLINTKNISGGKVRFGIKNLNAEIVYYPSCTNTIFGSHTSEAFLELCQKAGITIKIPGEIANLCCGTPWKSKGIVEGYRLMRARTGEILNKETRDGELIIVSDNSSCTQGIIELNSELKVMDVVTFVLNNIVPKLTITKVNSLAVHPTCATTKLEINDDLVLLGKAIANEVYIPDSWSCCGYGGDRGGQFPELTESATRGEASEINARLFNRYVSCNQTCEVGMTESTGKNYQHIIQVVNELSL